MTETSDFADSVQFISEKIRTLNAFRDVKHDAFNLSVVQAKVIFGKEEFDKEDAESAAEEIDIHLTNEIWLDMIRLQNVIPDRIREG